MCALWKYVYIMKQCVHYETMCALWNYVYIMKLCVHYETMCALWNNVCIMKQCVFCQTIWLKYGLKNQCGTINANHQETEVRNLLPTIHQANISLGYSTKMAKLRRFSKRGKLNSSNAIISIINMHSTPSKTLTPLDLRRFRDAFYLVCLMSRLSWSLT